LGKKKDKNKKKKFPELWTNKAGTPEKNTPKHHHRSERNGLAPAKKKHGGPPPTWKRGKIEGPPKNKRPENSPRKNTLKKKKSRKILKNRTQKGEAPPPKGKTKNACKGGEKGGTKEKTTQKKKGKAQRGVFARGAGFFCWLQTKTIKVCPTWGGRKLKKGEGSK